MKEKLFTKSAFKVALTCPTQLYYYRNHEYANQNQEDEFLQSLAEGGFQVGELAKVYYGIDGDHDIKSLDYAVSLRQTQRLLQDQNVNIAEAAFQWGNCFVRVDILEKVGSTINLIEVKAKSWNEQKDSFMGAGRAEGCVASGIREYVYDAAFQKYVVTNALKEQYPGQHFTVHAYLMMADKTSVADVDGINQCFRIVKHGNRSMAVREPGAESLANVTHVLKTYDAVDPICDTIIAGQTLEQPALMHATFKEFVERMSHIYCDNIRVYSSVGAGCVKCPFYDADTDSAGKLNGKHECLAHSAHFSPTDFGRPSTFDLNGAGGVRAKVLNSGKFFLDQLTTDDLKVDSGKGKLSSSDRRWLHIGMATDDNGILQRFRHNIIDGAYIDIPGLRQELDSYTYPLHMIDFETATVALPFYKDMHPYEEIAFQFSHHTIDLNPDGTYSIRHAGQFINTEKGHFPNFDFLRELKAQLDHDRGTIFRYSHHENTYLNAIMRQLYESSEPDRDELIKFILDITHHKVDKSDNMDLEPEHIGNRDMVDLCRVISDYYFHPSMKGRTSIKVVLPAVLNSSRFLQQKYSQPIYGSQIPSLNIPASAPIAWITFMDDGKTVENPYHLLPSVASYLDLTEDQIEREPDYDDMTISHGGAALTAYSKLQFSDTNQSEALSKALLRYCELDTMAMVFIWEYFYNMIKNN